VSRIGAGLSTEQDTVFAARDAARQAGAGLADGVDLAFVFLSPAHRSEAAEAADVVREELTPRNLLGCTAQGIVARDREVEEGSAVAVWAGSLPGAEIETFHADVVEEDGEAALTGFPSLEGPDLVALFADPFTFPVGGLLEALNEQAPDTPLVGGIAVAGEEAGSAGLILDGDVHESGAVGAVVAGVPVKAVVSQGCAPIGRDAVITRAEENVVFELAGRPALVRLHEELAGLSEETQLQAAKGLLAGLVIDENLPEHGRGDFLVRGILGVDERTGALALADHVRVGQTLRFHVRDARAADEDLREALARELGSSSAVGALLFTCNGRGRHMFSEAHHDARAVSQALGADALAGFFCGGEIGPVGGRSFLHGFTATLAVFLAEETGEP
jgi:small ligand-binding sensory domain FIST